MANLKKLNSDIRRAKKAKVAPKVRVEPPAVPAVDFDPLVKAIEKLQQPVINVQQKDPVSYRVTVDLNSRGDMVGATMEPIK